MTSIPTALRNAQSWLVWRLVQAPGEKKPRKVPYYANGEVREGAQGAHEPLVSYERAVETAAKGRYSGVGLAMLRSNGLVALDFDDCVVDGVIDERVEALIEGTYSEFSPSGSGVRAFFRGDVRDRKDLKGDLKVEFFCGAGYVTVTGQVTPLCDMWGWGDTVAELTEAVLALHGGGAVTADDDWLVGLAPKVGLSIEKARAFIDALDPDGGYDDWLKAGQSLHHEFDGAEAAMLVWQEWSKKSTEKYPGDRAIRAKWESFGRYVGAPITAAWLLKHSKVAKVAARYEAVAEWKERIGECDEYDLREKVSVEIARDARLDVLDREALAQAVMKRFKAHGTTLPIGSVRRLLAPPESMVPTVRRERPLTEFGMAERMLDRWGDSLMYVPETDRWYVWEGVVWRGVSKVEVEHYAKETVRGLVKEVDDWADQGEFFDFCRVAQQAKMVHNMVSLASSDPRVMVPAAELDKHSGLVAVQNGVLDLADGRLLAPDPAYRLTLQMGCRFVPDAACPLFESTLLDVFGGDAALVEFFQRLIGYALTGQPKEDVMVIPFGNGSNGKSTVLNTVRKVFGTYARSAAASSFVSDGRSDNAGGPREDLVRLQGARFLYVNEPEENAELKEGAVKAMTGGDAITARTVFAKVSVEIEPTWLIVMPTNHKPIVKGSDNGIWRRLVLIPFEQNFEGRPDKDVNRGERLAAEAEGVLAWMLRGMQAYRKAGLTKPDSVRRAGESYRSQMDLLADWLEQFCEVGPGYYCEMSRLWASWESYAKTNGVIHYVRSSAALGRRLDSRFPSSRGNSGARIRTGIRLRESDSDCGDWFS